MAYGRVRVYKPAYHNWESGDLVGGADLIGYSASVADASDHPVLEEFLSSRGYESNQISGGMQRSAVDEQGRVIKDPNGDALAWHWDQDGIIPEGFVSWHGVEIKPPFSDEDLVAFGNLVVRIADAGSNGVFVEDNRTAMPVGPYGDSVGVIAYKN